MTPVTERADVGTVVSLSQDDGSIDQGTGMDDRGREASNPWAMPVRAWISVAKRTWAETSADNIGLIAAGVAFYGFLALVPLLGAIVLIYGLLAEPATVMRDMTQMTSVMPADVAKLVGEQLLNVVHTSDGKKGLGLLLAFGLALFGARNGAGAIITALNIVYEEDEKRGFVHVNLLAIGITAAAVLIAIVALVAVAALGHLQSVFPHAPDIVILGGKIGAYLLLTSAGAGAAATLYRYGPSRRRAKWVWLTPGSLFAALLWLALTIGFGIYVANFGNYNATYGSLGAVVVTLTWLFLSSYILLFGAELNSELEHQTAQDTTHAGAPLGERGAWVADHVADGEPASAQPLQGVQIEPAGREAGTVSTSRRKRPTAHVRGLTGYGAALAGILLLGRNRTARGAGLLIAAGTVALLTRDSVPSVKTQ